MCRDAVVFYSCGCERPAPREPCMWREMLTWEQGAADEEAAEWEEKCAEEEERAQDVRERAWGCPGCWPEAPAEEGWEVGERWREAVEDGGEEAGGGNVEPEAEPEPEPEDEDEDGDGEWTGGFVR